MTSSGGIVVVGKIIVDEFSEHGGSMRTTVGGGGPQAAFGAALCNLATPPLLVSVAGDDLSGSEQLMQQLRETGGDVSGVKFMQGYTTPHFRITIDKDDIPHHEMGTGFENWQLMLDVDLDLPPTSADSSSMHVLVEKGGYNELRLARQWVSQGRNAPNFLSFEPVMLRDSPQEDYDAFRAIVGECNAVSPDWHTACQIARLPEKTATPAEVIAYWSRLGPEAVTIRCGRDGSYLYRASDSTSWHIPIAPVSTVDVTGAGNAYAAAFAAMIGTRQVDALDSAAFASAAGAAAVLGAGLPPMSDALKNWTADAAEDVRARITKLS